MSDTLDFGWEVKIYANGNVSYLHSKSAPHIHTGPVSTLIVINADPDVISIKNGTEYSIDKTRGEFFTVRKIAKEEVLGKAGGSPSTFHASLQEAMLIRDAATKPPKIAVPEWRVTVNLVGGSDWVRDFFDKPGISWEGCTATMETLYVHCGDLRAEFRAEHVVGVILEKKE